MKNLGNTFFAFIFCIVCIFLEKYARLPFVSFFGIASVVLLSSRKSIVLVVLSFVVDFVLGRTPGIMLCVVSVFLLLYDANFIGRMYKIFFVGLLTLATVMYTLSTQNSDGRFFQVILIAGVSILFFLFEKFRNDSAYIDTG